MRFQIEWRNPQRWVKYAGSVAVPLLTLRHSNERSIFFLINLRKTTIHSPPAIHSCGKHVSHAVLNTCNHCVRPLIMSVETQFDSGRQSMEPQRSTPLATDVDEHCHIAAICAFMQRRFENARCPRPTNCAQLAGMTQRPLPAVNLRFVDVWLQLMRNSLFHSCATSCAILTVIDEWAANQSFHYYMPSGSNQIEC